MRNILIRTIWKLAVFFVAWVLRYVPVTMTWWMVCGRIIRMRISLTIKTCALDCGRRGKRYGRKGSKQ